jgi:hypothetical protein
MAIEIKLTKDAYGELLAENPKLAKEYTADPKSEGDFVLAGAAGWESADAITGLLSSLRKERENVSAAKREGAQLKELVDELTAAAESGQNAADGDLQKQFNTLQEQFNALNGTLSKERTARTIAEVSAANRGNVALRDHLARRVQTDADGKAIVVDPDTSQPLLDTEGKAMTPDAYAKHLLALSDTKAGAEYGALFIGARSSGGGTPPGGGSGGGKLPAGNLKRSTMTPRAKVNFINQHGDAEYQKLPL